MKENGVYIADIGLLNSLVWSETVIIPKLTKPIIKRCNKKLMIATYTIIFSLLSFTFSDKK